MKRFAVYAEQGDAGQTRVMGEADTAEEAMDLVDNLDSYGDWPEGWNAIIADTVTAARFLYTDQLEKL